MPVGKPPGANCAVQTKVLRVALDSLALGVAIVDRGLNLKYANAQALQILAKSSGSRINGSAITTINSSLGAQLRPIVDQVLQGPSRHADARLIRLPNQAMPIEVLGACACPTQSLVVLYLRDYGSVSNDVAEVFARLYGLTPTEARTAVLLTREHSLAEVAVALNVSTATVRSHVKALLRKTGTRRQVEMVCRISSGLTGWIRTAPLAGGDIPSEFARKAGKRAQRRSRAASTSTPSGQAGRDG